ncbi:MAG: phosphotriesterase family protein [bacterium]
MRGKIATVKGPIDPSEMGLTLPHEHVMCDFIGADKTGKHRYRQEDVVEAMKPYLLEIRDMGVKTFVDCTPMYLGRDVEVLKELSEMTGLHILTNTGQYKEPYLPEETFRIGARELAQQWIREYEEGIDGTDIKPGFIKTAVNPGRLIPIQRKIIESAGLTSLETGLAIATHTGAGVAAMEVLDILEGLGVEADRWIYVHAQNEEDRNLLLEVARRGAWIELDGIGPESAEKHLNLLLELLDAGFENKVLLSQDAGWYRVGEEHGGAKRPFTYLLDRFIPLAKERGISDETIRTITIANPSVAFAVR